MSQQSSKMPTTGRLWGGRFEGGSDPLMDAYNASINFDRAFYAQDIAGSIAFARANVATKILTPAEFAAIERGFAQIRQEWDSGAFDIKPEVDEDIHSANERRLREIIGPTIAGKLHTRNDQVATDIRLWLRDELRIIEKLLAEFLQEIARRAEAEIDHVMPGYTHLQRAQPVRWSHWLLSYASYFLDDLERLRQVTARVNRSPLGFGALSGNAFGINRQQIAEELGFDGLLTNSMAGVGDRDPILEALQWGSMLMTHVSRWSEDLIIYGTAEFGFIRLSDAFSSGSSLMPQKTNADSLELLRGKCGRVFGAMAGFMMTVKGLPSTYNKDLQESLEPAFEVVKTLRDSLTIATRVLGTLTVFPDKMLAALSPDMLATDLAEHLVRKGLPFRETHEIAGKVVKLAETTRVPMDRLSLDQLQQIDARFDESALRVFDYEQSVERKTASGGTSRSAVLEQIALLKKSLE